MGSCISPVKMTMSRAMTGRTFSHMQKINGLAVIDFRCYICTVQEIVVTQPIWSLRSSSHMLDSSTGKELQLNENPSAGWNLITNSLVRTTSPTTTSKINIL